MNIQKSEVTKIIITGVENLDPVAVYLEDHGNASGKIIITCYGASWTHYWSHMGEGNTLIDFFCSCDEHYIAKKLAPGIETSITNYSALIDHAKRDVFTERRMGEISKEKARELFNLIESFGNDGEYLFNDRDSMYEIFGDEYWYGLPTEPNHEYQYICRIINTVKDALKTDLAVAA